MLARCFYWRSTWRAETHRHRFPLKGFNESTSPSLSRVRLASPKASDAEAFKRTIIDNNLFRPLGWRPPRPIEPYRLLGTILPTDKNTLPQAIIQAAAGNKTHIVSIGETLDADTKIVDIQPKQVTLEKAGQRRTLKLETSLWMNAAKGRDSHRR